MAVNFCPTCGTAVNPGARFCAAFGHSLSGPTVGSGGAGLGSTITPQQPVAPTQPVIPPPPVMPAPLPVVLPAPPSSSGVAMGDAAVAKPKGKNSGGMIAAGILGGLGLGAVLIGILAAGSQHASDSTSYQPVQVGKIEVTQVGAQSCVQTVHGGYVYENNCTTTVTLAISKDVPSQEVSVLMDYPYGAFHGYAVVKTGFRGTVIVPLKLQFIGSGCKPYPSYATTVFVYDGHVVSGSTNQKLASAPFTLKLGCK